MIINCASFFSSFSLGSQRSRGKEKRRDSRLETRYTSSQLYLLSENCGICTISVVPTTLSWPSVARFFAICAWMRSSSSTVKLLPRLSVDWHRRLPNRSPSSTSSSSSSSSTCATWARSECSRKTDVSGLGCGRRPFDLWRMTSWKVLVGCERPRGFDAERPRDLFCCSGEAAL